MQWGKGYLNMNAPFCHTAGVLSVKIITPSNSEIICGQNVGTKVVCGIIFFFEKESYAENLKKIVGAV